MFPTDEDLDKMHENWVKEADVETLRTTLGKLIEAQGRVENRIKEIVEYRLRKIEELNEQER